ncbi:hypothetical protein, partial [Lactococcus petauri]|uniref:hypothetical protein n=1 Tax=Lactococcus petauri TaxID=1940789 RepID=UPI0021F0A857
NDLDAINEEVRKRRARGEDVPYVTVGSKVMNKLNPADALDSYAPRVIVGVDTQMNTGIMINQDFAINKIGRDHDGDDMAIFWQDE